MADQPAGNAWSAIVLDTSDAASRAAEPAPQPQMLAGSTPEDWTITVPTASGEISIARSDGSVMVEQEVGAGARVETLDLEPGPDTASDGSAIRAGFDDTAARYPAFQDGLPRRVAVTGMLAVLLAAQEDALLLLRRRWPAFYPALRVLSLACWIGLAAWPHFSFLRSWEVLQLT